MTAAAADISFALDNLEREGVAADRIHFVGNVMIDSLLTFKAKAQKLPLLSEMGLVVGKYACP